MLVCFHIPFYFYCCLTGYLLVYGCACFVSRLYFRSFAKCWILASLLSLQRKGKQALSCLLVYKVNGASDYYVMIRGQIRRPFSCSCALEISVRIFHKSKNKDKCHSKFLYWNVLHILFSIIFFTYWIMAFLSVCKHIRFWKNDNMYKVCILSSKEGLETSFSVCRYI